jgi:hypothetical protein
MNIYLGNFSISQMEERLDIKFPNELVTYMTNKHQDSAGKLAKDKWHCFDIPFVLVCENIEMATVIYNYLKPFTHDMKDQMMISIQGGHNEAVRSEMEGRKGMDAQDQRKAVKENIGG